MSTNIRVGDKAPDFTLPDINMNPRSLRDFLGTGHKILLAFSVNDFTMKCTEKACEFRDFVNRLINLNAHVVGISGHDPFINADIAEKNRLCFPVLWDYKRRVFRNYGLCGKKSGEYADCSYPSRSIFVLDTNGIVKYLWVSVNRADEPDYQEIQEQMKETNQTVASMAT